MRDDCYLIRFSLHEESMEFVLVGESIGHQVSIWQIPVESCVEAIFAAAFFVFYPQDFPNSLKYGNNTYLIKGFEILINVEAVNHPTCLSTKDCSQETTDKLLTWQ